MGMELAGIPGVKQHPHSNDGTCVSLFHRKKSLHYSDIQRFSVSLPEVFSYTMLLYK